MMVYGKFCACMCVCACVRACVCVRAYCVRRDNLFAAYLFGALGEDAAKASSYSSIIQAGVHGCLYVYQCIRVECVAALRACIYVRVYVCVCVYVVYAYVYIA